MQSPTPTSPDLVPVRRALLSVSDKTGLEWFARALHDDFNVQLISTGGTAKFLRDLKLPVTDVAELTGFPEMMDGRVKTLHPKIHGALLAKRDDAEHLKAMKEHGIEPIDLVCINLYPFEETIAKPNVTFDEAIENIDIGGPSMIRSAAKNHAHVVVVTAPERYEDIINDLHENDGNSSARLRLRQAQRAFALTAEYDSVIANYLATAGGIDSSSVVLNLSKVLDLRYGENPHQKAALLVGKKPAAASVAFSKQLHGKELSYINLLDADAALACVKEFPDHPAACIVKHATPCGVAIADMLPDAFRNAFASDPLASFGGIVALNRPIDLPTAEAIVSIDKLLEVIVAPLFEVDALALLRSRWKNVRLLEVGSLAPLSALGERPGEEFANSAIAYETELPPSQAPPAYAERGRSADIAELHFHKIFGGYLAEQRDTAGIVETEWKVVSKRQPTEAEMRNLKLAWLACKHVKSNAIVLAKNRATIGIGGGQVDRVGAAKIAIEKAGTRAAGSVAASDAFFPFPDGPKALIAAGVTAIVQPGGSVKDADAIHVANDHNAAMILTGRRHFRH